MSSRIQILTEFKSSLVNFLDELIEQFPEEGDLIVLRIFLNDQVPIEDVMNTFVNRLLPLKEIVKKRDESFFLNNNILFEKLNKDKVNHFKTLWTSSKLDNDDRDVIWSWYDLFVSIAERYSKTN
jgi:hypothetical protein